VASIGSPTVPRGAVGARSAARVEVLTPARGSTDVAGALSGFPATSRAMTSMPDALPRAGTHGANGASRAIPRDAVTAGSNGMPAVRSEFPDARGSVPRAEISNSNGRVSSRGADGFPTSTAAPRAVPRGVEGPSGGSAVRAEPSVGVRGGSNGPSGSSGSSGYRAVPPGPQGPPVVDRGRSVPRESAPPPTYSPYQPTMPAERRAPSVSAPQSAPPSVVPRGYSGAPAPAPAQSAPPAAAPLRGGGSSGGASQGTATVRSRGGGRGGQ